VTENECTEPGIGRLLHAYELGILSEDDQIRYERHLLACESCSAKVQRLLEVGRLLRSTGLTELAATAGAPDEGPPESRLASIWRYIWPKAPVPFRPALLFLILLILAYPAARGLFSPLQQRIERVQSISLFPNRSQQIEAVKLEDHFDVLMTFVYDECLPGHGYEIVIAHESGEVLYRQTGYRGFDEFGTGRLLIPSELLKDGRYRVIVTDPERDSSGIQEYRFSVVR
jgi:hypothetical protein